jgi:two-component system CheB/CheR fusion protein
MQTKSILDALSGDILATLREPFFVLGKDKRVIIASSAFCDTFEVSESSTIGTLIYDLGNHQWDIPLLRSLIDDILPKNNSVRDFEVSHAFPSIGHKIMLVNATHFPPGDNAELILFAIEDITNRRQCENMKIQSGVMIDLHRRKDEFLAMLSHELRNPLASIQNSVSLLHIQQDENNSILVEARGIIERQTAQLKHLTDELLEVSRIATGRVVLRTVRVDIRTIVTGSVLATKHIIEEKKQKLILSLPDEPVWLEADPNRIEQVIVNILTNAAKYSNEGGRIRLGVSKESDGTIIFIEVEDNGVGIAPEFLPLIFDLFSQADRSLDRAQNGLGLGLNLVRRVVELHGGTVEAFSGGINKGSKFVIKLPISQNAAINPLPKKEINRPQRVLVVDDDLDTVKSLSLLLRLSGYDTRTAMNGPDAITSAIEYQPEFAIMDIGLPGMSGYEVAKAMRENPKLKQIRMIAATGYGLESAKVLAQEAGFDAHITKPVVLGKLIELMNSTMAK